MGESEVWPGCDPRKNEPVSLRGAPLEADVSTPDGTTVHVRIGVAQDSYIPASELETVTIELSANGEHVAGVSTVLDPDETSEALALMHEIISGLASGELPATAGALEPLADRLR